MEQWKERCQSFLEFLKKHIPFCGETENCFCPKPILVEPYTKEQKEIFDEIQEGDVVFCRMPMEEEMLEKVPEGHRERPYVIVKKDEETLYGYYCTTHPKKNLKEYELYYFPKHCFKKDTREFVHSYVVTNRIFQIPIANVRFIDFHLEEYQMEQINRRIYACRNHGKMDVIRFPVKDKLREGDIVKYKKEYWYVLQEEAQNGEPRYEIIRLQKKSAKKSKSECLSWKSGPCILDLESRHWTDATETIRLNHLHYIAPKNVQEEMREKIQEEKQRKKKQESAKIKKNTETKKIPDYQVKYVVGSIWVDKFAENEKIYLFSQKYIHYFFDEYTEHVQKISGEELGFRYEIVDELTSKGVEELLEVAYWRTNRNQSIHWILKELLETHRKKDDR